MDQCPVDKYDVVRVCHMQVCREFQMPVSRWLVQPLPHACNVAEGRGWDERTCQAVCHGTMTSCGCHEGLRKAARGGGEGHTKVDLALLESVVKCGAKGEVIRVLLRALHKLSQLVAARVLILLRTSRRHSTISKNSVVA